jgi:hypothetical protein
MKIILEYFIAAVFITAIILYFLYPNPKVILKYPSTTQNISDLYVDENNICYRYHRKEVNCHK